MSYEVRLSLATAANAVIAVNVAPYYWQTIKLGDGYVTLARKARDASGLGFLSTWRVVIVLKEDYDESEKFLDDHSTALIEALSTEMVVTSVTPDRLPAELGSTPCVVIEGVREDI